MKAKNILKNKKKNTLIIIVVLATILICINIMILFHFINQNNMKKIFSEHDLNMEETVAIYEVEKEVDLYCMVAVISILLLATVCLISNYILNKKQEKRMKKIRQVIKNLDSNDYHEFIEEHEEGEFGLFQSEVYQTVIRLHEYSKMIEDDRKKLSSHLLDISHQLRTPLLSITILVDNLLQSEIQNPNNKKLINDISTQLDKMKWLVDNLLKMAQLDTRVVNLRQEKIIVEQLIKNVVQNVEILLELYGQEIIVTGDKEISFIGDFKWNVEAITNIVKNSIEHSKSETKLYIRYEENVLYTEIRIKDSGCGISEKDLYHIFDRFYKGKNSDSNSFGIGLSLAKEIIEYQNGEITVKSKVNEGSEFIIKYYK